MKRTILTASASALLLVGAGGANAGILNASFEIPVVPAFTQGFIQDWTGSAGQPFYYGVETSFSPQPVPDGNQGAYVNNFANLGGAGVPSSHSIAQQLTDVLLANTQYTLSGYFGWRSDNAQSTGGIELYAGGSVVDGDVIGGVLLGSSSVTLTQNQWVLGSVSYNAAALDPNLGQLLNVRLLGTPNGNYFAQTNFDQVELSVATVPEPGSLALLGLGLFGLKAARRRKSA